MFDRRLVTHFDWGLLAIVVAICSIGIGILYSAVNAGADASQSGFVVKQLVWFGIGGTAMVVCFLVSYRHLEQWGLLVYLGVILLLVLVVFFGKYVGGSKRWLALGPISLQPSELAKIGVIIVLARHYARNATTDGLSLKDLAIPAGLIFIPFVFILRQPDLGTALLLLLIGGVMTLFVGLKRRTFMVLLASGSCSVVAAWFFLLKAYQKQRVLTFLDPDRDPLGAGYHIIQSKIAIGSGMLFGKGYLKGTQNALAFLPEQHTDFILSVLAEEWGLVGCLVLLACYLLFLAWSLNIAHRCRDAFGTILVVGVTAMNFWHVFINMGMVMGLLPVVGVPLPLISYGGSSVVSTLLGVGILMNVSMRRFQKE